MKKRRVFSVFCISLLIFSFLTLSGCYCNNKTQSMTERKITIQTINSTVVQNGENSYVEQTVKANIIKNETYTYSLIIDWFLSWEKDSNEDISQYIQISKSSSDSTLCYVKCYKSFNENNIILTAKIQNSNIQDSCLIVFEGVPSSLNYDVESFAACDTVSIDGKTIYLLDEYDFISVGFIYNNIFQNVNKKIFLENCDIKINSYGSLLLIADEFYEFFDLKDFVNSSYGYASLINYEFDPLAGCLEIKTIEVTLSESFCYVSISDEYCFTKVANTKEDLPYLEFIVTDNVYGFSTSFYIGFNFV